MQVQLLHVHRFLCKYSKKQIISAASLEANDISSSVPSPSPKRKCLPHLPLLQHGKINYVGNNSADH